MNTLTATKVFAAVGVVLFAALILVANPSGDFPLNDDWNYAHSVKQLMSHGQLMITCWTLAASVTQIVAGAIWCSLTGFSFDSLRCLSLVMATLAILQTIPLVTKIARSRWTGYAAAGSMMVNPLFFVLACTFMTDIPFLCLALALTVTLNSLDEKPSTPTLVLACVLSILVMLLRQIGIVIPIAFALSCLVTRSQTSGCKPTSLAFRLAPLATGLVTIAIFQYWLNTTQQDLFSYRTEHAYLMGIVSKGPLSIASHFTLNLFRALMYIGFLGLPIFVRWVPAMLRNWEGKHRTLFLMLCAELIILVFGGLVFWGQFMPLADNVLIDFGLGPIFGGGDGSEILKHWHKAPLLLWAAITFGSVTGMSILLGALTIMGMRMKQLGTTRTVVFYILTVAMYLAVDCFRGFFDRYMIFVMPYMIALVASQCSENTASHTEPGWLKPFHGLCALAGTVLWISYACFCVQATHDYFSYNRARWDGLNYLTNEQKIAPDLIDGGLEFNGWHAYDGGKKLTFDTTMKHGDRYLVTNYAAPGYKQIKTYVFERWLAPTPGTVYVLESNQTSELTE